MPRRRAPFWFQLLLTVAAAVVLRVALPPEAPDAPMHAFIGLLILVGSLIWKGVEAAGKVTLAVLRWIVVNLSLAVVKMGNVLADTGHRLVLAFRRVWDFTKTIYSEVLKPAWVKFWGWFDKFRTWMDETIGPVLSWLKELRDNILGFYKVWVQPWLDLIDITRKGLRVLAAMGIEWARALDARLGKIEAAIEKPFRYVLAKLNEVIGIVNRVVTLDGLLQRLVLVRSLERDYVYAWRAAMNPWRRLLSSDESKRMRAALTVKGRAKVTSDFVAVLSGRGGDDAAAVKEWAAQLRIYLRD